MLLIFTHYLRNFRKHRSFSFIFCGTSANIIQFHTLFAEFPQTLLHFAHYLQNFRKHYSILCIICGTSANGMQVSANLS